MCIQNRDDSFFPLCLRLTYENDIAVLTVNQSTYFRDEIVPICLPRKENNMDNLENRKGIVTGILTFIAKSVI